MTTRALAVGATLLATALTSAAPALAATSTIIRPTDLDHSLPVADGASGNAGYEFLSNGLHVKVDDQTGSYVVLRWKVNQPFASITEVDFGWTGTANRPGIKYDVDVTGDGTIDCELQGEQNTTAVWLNKSTVDFTGSDVASTPAFCEDLAPHKTKGPTSYPNDGTFAEWSTALGAKASVVDGGISASDAAQDGTLQSVTFGDLTNTFSKDPATSPAPVLPVPTALGVEVAQHKVTKGKPATIDGVVEPALAGTPIHLLKKVRHGSGARATWVPIRSAAVGTDGRYTFHKRFKNAGVKKLRVQTSATREFTSTTSRTFKVKVR